ncbi:MAG: arylesterase [Methylophaga sp.]|nr:MAG: arylesterase [Methylophaga sp.]
MKQKHTFNIAHVLLIVFFLVSCTGDSQPTLSTLDKNAVILAFGDSLTYGTGADPATQSYPAVLSDLTGFKVVNAGVPGEITQQGLARLPAVLDQVKPDLVILCHGGNDLIRKIGQQQIKNNLDEMIKLIQSKGAQVVLIGVPNFNFTLSVPELYKNLAQFHHIPAELEIMPKLERSPKLKADQIHPNADGYKLFAERIYALLQQSQAL